MLKDDLGTLVLFGRPKHRIGLLQLGFELFEFSLFFNRFSLGVVRRTEFLVDGLPSKGHLFEQAITFCTTIFGFERVFLNLNGLLDEGVLQSLRPLYGLGEHIFRLDLSGHFFAVFMRIGGGF